MKTSEEQLLLPPLLPKETTVYTFYDPLDYCQPPLLDSPDRRDFSHWTRKEKKSSPNPVRRKIRSLFHFENPWELIRAAEYGVHSGLKSVKKCLAYISAPKLNFL